MLNIELTDFLILLAIFVFGFLLAILGQSFYNCMQQKCDKKTEDEYEYDAFYTSNCNAKTILIKTTKNLPLDKLIFADKEFVLTDYKKFKRK